VHRPWSRRRKEPVSLDNIIRVDPDSRCQEFKTVVGCIIGDELIPPFCSVPALTDPTDSLASSLNVFNALVVPHPSSLDLNSHISSPYRNNLWYISRSSFLSVSRWTTWPSRCGGRKTRAPRMSARREVLYGQIEAPSGRRL